MLFESAKRMFFLLFCVGYCIEFPKRLACRIAGHPEWTRHVMYHALREGYLELYEGKFSKRLISSLRLTDKGLKYIAERNIDAFLLIMSRRTNISPGSHSSPITVLRFHAFATAMIMANNAGAMVMSQEKPPITRSEYNKASVPIDPDIPYFYSTYEIRESLMECFPETTPKTSRIAGVIVQGASCYCMYHTGHTRIYWMRSVEENFAATVQSVLNTRGFRIKYIKQILIGSRAGVAAKLSRSTIYKGTRYFVLSDFYNNSYFLTDDSLGDFQLKVMLDRQRLVSINREVLANCHMPDVPSRIFDAIDNEENRPVILNYLFDLLILPDIDLTFEGFKELPLIYCFDHQVDIQQQIAGVSAEVRGIGGTTEYEKK